MTKDWPQAAPDPEAIARLDTGVAHISRVYDYLLGGKDNFAADRAAGDEFVKVMPGILPGVREARAFLDEAARTLDFTRPVAVMLVGVLHCIPDDGDPWGIVKRITAAVPPGSHLVVGHPASDIQAEATQATAGLNTRIAEPVTFRPRDQVSRFLDGLEVLEPGVVSYSQWRPGPEATAAPPTPAWCAVARKG